MYSNTYNRENFIIARNLIDNKEFNKAYELLQTITNKCGEWFYLTGVSAINIGNYKEGKKYLKIAVDMEPENKEYDKAISKFSRYRDDYNDRAYRYNRRRRSDLDGCCCCCCDDCCCCCGDDCCEDCAKLWCLDSCCECCGGDLVDCF